MVELATVQELIEELKAGRPIVVADDEIARRDRHAADSASCLQRDLRGDR